MSLVTSFESFERGWKAGQNQIVYARLTADLDTPVSLMLKLAEARTDTFMLESVTGGEIRGRYSVVGMKPDLIWQCHGQDSRISTASGRPSGSGLIPGRCSTSRIMSSPRAGSRCRPTCPRSRRASSAISAMT